MCELGKVGFCSPFIHEEANARLAEQGITTPPARGDRHGDTHVHSPYIEIQVIPSLMIQSYNVTVPMIVNDPGHFYGIGALQFYTYDQNNVTPGENATAEYRYDVANALDVPLITYENEPEILTVTTPIKILTYLLIGVACAAILFLLYETIKHRDNNVIKVSQGNFLIVFLLAGLWASVAAILLEPKNDVYCNLVNPMIFVPLQLMFSITIGRLWRIQAVVSPLLIRKLKQERSFANRFGRAMGDFTTFAWWHRQRSSKTNVRRTISSRQLARVVSLFTLPQVIMQIVGGSLHPDEATIDFNENESIGRQICESRIDNPWRDFRTYSVILLLLLFIILLVVSYACRKLPSLLNETSSISNSTIESLVALVIGFAIIAITESPSSSPDIAYLVSVLMVLTLTLNSTWRIMLPKLRMVWRGENVVISKLVSDSRQRQTEREQLLSGVTGFTPNPNAPPQNHASSVNSSGFTNSFGASLVRSSTRAYSSENSNSEQDLLYNNAEIPYGGGGKVSQAEMDERERVVSFKEDTEDEKLVVENVPPEGVTTEDAALPIQADMVNRKDGEDEENTAISDDHPASPNELPESPLSLKLAELRAKSKAALKRVEEVSGESHQPPNGAVPSELGPRHHLRHRRHHHQIAICDDETPSRRLVLRMVDLHLVLSRVNQRILSGLAVSHDDWKRLQELSIDLGITFEDEVKFQWEQEDDTI